LWQFWNGLPDPIRAGEAFSNRLGERSQLVLFVRPPDLAVLTALAPSVVTML